MSPLFSGTTTGMAGMMGTVLKSALLFLRWRRKSQPQSLITSLPMEKTNALLAPVPLQTQQLVKQQRQASSTAISVLDDGKTEAAILVSCLLDVSSTQAGLLGCTQQLCSGTTIRMARTTAIVL